MPPHARSRRWLIRVLVGGSLALFAGCTDRLADGNNEETDQEGVVILEHEIVDDPTRPGNVQIVGVVHNRREETIEAVEIYLVIYRVEPYTQDVLYHETKEMAPDERWEFSIPIREPEDWFDMYDISIETPDANPGNSLENMSP